MFSSQVPELAVSGAPRCGVPEIEGEAVLTGTGAGVHPGGSEVGERSAATT